MPVQRRLPEWFKVKMPGGPNYLDLRDKLRSERLHTVCEEARCPNIGECWELGTATFMILGDVCTRACAYCAVTSGVPQGLDLEEPVRLAETVENLGLRYAVITSVNRDDLPDGGAFIFSQCVSQIRKRVPGCKIELLIPDFEGNWDALSSVMRAKPDTLNHNIETVRRLFRRMRPRGRYDQSLELLERAKRLDANAVTKSGMMVGLGENWDEILDTMRDLRSVDCDLLTIGQYLRPSAKHARVIKWYAPDEFDALRREGEALGFRHVASGPLVRSSYHADAQHEAAAQVAV